VPTRAIAGSTQSRFPSAIPVSASRGKRPLLAPSRNQRNTYQSTLYASRFVHAHDSISAAAVVLTRRHAGSPPCSLVACQMPVADRAARPLQTFQRSRNQDENHEERVVRRRSSSLENPSGTICDVKQPGNMHFLRGVRLNVEYSSSGRARSARSSAGSTMTGRSSASRCQSSKERAARGVPAACCSQTGCGPECALQPAKLDRNASSRACPSVL